jgi:hypothetical protein
MSSRVIVGPRLPQRCRAMKRLHGFDAITMPAGAGMIVENKYQSPLLFATGVV